MTKRRDGNGLAGVWLLYLLVLAGLVVFLAQCDSGERQTFKAAAALPAGHRLVTGDIVLPGAPHYVVADIAAGQPVTPDKVSSLLAADPPKGSLALVFKFVGSGAAKLPNTGDKLWICPDPAKQAPVAVLSAQCDARIGSCLAVVAVPAARAGAIAALADPQLSATPCPEPPK